MAANPEADMSTVAINHLATVDMSATMDLEGQSHSSPLGGPLTTVGITSTVARSSPSILAELSASQNGNEELTTVAITSTVVRSDPSTGEVTHFAKAELSASQNDKEEMQLSEHPVAAAEEMTTVDRYIPPTVAEPESPAEFISGDDHIVNAAGWHGDSQRKQGREEVLEIATDIMPPTDSGTVVNSSSTTIHPEIKIQRPSKEVALWITEQGDLVPEGRVKRIRLAQDVINSAEESVYDTLWAAKNQTDEREASRVVQAGYDYLVKRTRLSKKTIQRIIAKLIDKDFIAIERPADIYQRTSTVYRVFSYKAVLDRHQQRGRFHVAKMGPGFSYVRPMEDPRRSALNSAPLAPSGPARQADLTTVDTARTPTVVGIVPSTPANRTTDTVARSDPSTMVPATISFIGKNVLENNTSSLPTIYQVLNKYGAADDEIVDRLIKNCKQQAPDCSDEEIIHFIEKKGSLVRVRDSRIYNPIGFLLTAVPKCLSGEAFRSYREEQMKLREAEASYEARRQDELDEWRREQEAQLEDPNVSEEDKQFIRKCLGVQ